MKNLLCLTGVLTIVMMKLKILQKFEGKIKIEDTTNGLWHENFAKLITEGKIGGLFQGRMEFGPRALGNRSIIGDARSLKTKDRINSVVKGRPHFQPFCPSILEEEKKLLKDHIKINT